MIQINDWMCRNTACDDKDKVEVCQDTKDPDPTCPGCGATMEKVIGGPRSKHISWSQWRV